MTDLLYLAYNRLEFTRKSFETMLANTDWSHVDRIFVYDDGSTDGTREYLEEQVRDFQMVLGKERVSLVKTQGLGPVGVMNHCLTQGTEDGLFIKIDNDVVLPPGWLRECLKVMRDAPELDFLGIEAMRPLGDGPRRFLEAAHIGGIGFMRRRAFDKCLPRPNGRFGFTAWQEAHPHVKKGWIDPAIPVCLLNLMPLEPWRSLSQEYVRQGWQRDWPPVMPESHSALWSWWVK